ncbi:TPA: hypothetical protein ACGCBI_000498 [Serratia marcescens]
MPNAPTEPSWIQVSSLLRELILRAATFMIDYSNNSREGLILKLILEEIIWSPEQGRHVSTGRDKRLTTICEAILANLQDNRTLDKWARQHVHWLIFLLQNSECRFMFGDSRRV